MIRFILLQNRAGKTRLAKYYTALDEPSRHALEALVHRTVTSRDPKHANVADLRGSGSAAGGGGSKKIVYRRYAGLYFVLGLDPGDSELAALEAVHLFVEVLDHYFANVRFLCRNPLLSPPSPAGLLGLAARAETEGIEKTPPPLSQTPPPPPTNNHPTPWQQVCELDLVFNFHKVYAILDEFVLGGEVQETSKRVMLERLAEIDRLEEVSKG
jgi:hypothetical protein